MMGAQLGGKNKPTTGKRRKDSGGVYGEQQGKKMEVSGKGKGEKVN